MAKWKPTREAMKRYYARDKDKPEFKKRRSDARREAYQYRRSLGLCCINGCNEDPNEKAYCPHHAELAAQSNERSRAKARKARETK